MVELRIKKKVDRTILSHKFKSDEQVCGNELETLQKNEFDSILYAKVSHFIFGKTLVYEAPNCIKLSEYLQQNITFDEFASIILQLLDIFAECPAYQMRASHLEKNPDYIFVDLSTKKIRMLYWPMFTLKEYLKDSAFFEMIICNYACDAHSAEAEKKKILMETVLSNSSFSLNNLKKQVNALLQTNASGSDGKTVIGVHLPVSVPQSQDTIPTFGIWTPCLIHISNENKKIMINHFPFTLGRSSKCDYSIPENLRVSRDHAELRKEGWIFSICDYEHTNGVKVNGEFIRKMENFPLNDGDKILLDKEEFVFYTSFVQ